jgi:hypothetical protein
MPRMVERVTAQHKREVMRAVSRRQPVAQRDKALAMGCWQIDDRNAVAVMAVLDDRTGHGLGVIRP